MEITVFFFLLLFKSRCYSYKERVRFFFLVLLFKGEKLVGIIWQAGNHQNSMLASVLVRSRFHKGRAGVIPCTAWHTHHFMCTSAHFPFRSAMPQNKVLVENVVLHPSNSFFLFPAHLFNGSSKMHPGNKRDAWQYCPLLYFISALQQIRDCAWRKALHSLMSWA